MGNKSTLGFSADIADRDQGGVGDKLRRTQLDFAYQLTSKLGLRAEAAKYDQSGEQASDVDNSENQYRLFFRASF